MNNSAIASLGSTLIVLLLAIPAVYALSVKLGRSGLGFDVGNTESQPFWTEFLRTLKVRGQAGTRLVISDANTGLIAAIGTLVRGASWHRCRVHFMRNVLTQVPKQSQEMVASIIRTVFAQPDGEHVSGQLSKVVTMLMRTLPKVALMREDAREDVTAFRTFPTSHWRQIWSTNPLERVNKEIKRRTDVVGVFPNPASLLHLAGAVLIEQHDEWDAADRRYFSEHSMKQLDATTGRIAIPEITAA